MEMVPLSCVCSREEQIITLSDSILGVIIEHVKGFSVWCLYIECFKEWFLSFCMTNAKIWVIVRKHAAAAAKSLQSCPILCDPIDGSPPGSPSLGFSRQEHWSGLPFPSPMHESEKWKWSRSVVSDPQQPHGLQPTRLLCSWDFPGNSTGVGCHCLLCWPEASYLQNMKSIFYFTGLKQRR